MRSLHATILLASVSSLGLALPATPQTAMPASPAAQQDGESQDMVVVTGSRIPGRTLADSPVPVDVIGGEQLTNAGYTETNKLLNQLVPSFNFPQPSITDGTDSLRPATLRGLAPDQTLVLVNGKRRHQAALLNLNGSVGRGSGAVDLNEIIPIAIDRIEILRDGASSLYGSDAIAGVINIQLSKRKGVRGSVTYGQYRTSMDGVKDLLGVQTDAAGNPVIAVSGGTNRANDILGLNYAQDDRVRHDGDTLTLASSIGLPMGEGGYFVFSSQFRDRDPTQRAAADPRRQYVAGDARELTANRFNHAYGDGKTRDMNLFVNAGTQIAGQFDLYTFGSYGIRDGLGAGFFRRPNDSRNRDWSASTTTFVPFYANGFLPFIRSEIADYSGAVGVKGEIADGWNADLSVVYGANSLDYSVENSFNTSLGGANSPRNFYAGGIRFGQTVANLDLSHRFDVGFLRSLGFAAGGEVRRENFQIRAGNPASYVNGPFVPNGAPGGAQVFPGFRPSNETNVSRNSFAGYVELDAEVSEALSVQAAGRYEHYSDFGDTVNGKLAGRLQLFPGVAIRGSISTGFRAPSLAQQYFSTSSTNNVAGTLLEILTVPVSSPLAIALGSKPLQPEKATNFGGGLTFDPIPGFNVTADYYQIRIRDRIVLSENLQGAAVNALLQAQGFAGVNSARFFVNGVDTKTQGVDVIATYRVPDFGYGRVSLTAGFNYNEQTITGRESLPSLPGLLVFGRAESYRLTRGQPNSKINLGADYELGRVSATIRTNRYGTVFSAGTATDLAIAPGAGAGDFTLAPKWITDAEVRVKPIEALELAIGADNLFDIYPTRAPVGGTFGVNNYFLPYSSLSPFGFNGRFLYARASVNF